MIFRFMDANKADFPIRFMAARFGVSPSGFYEWRYRQSHPSARTIEDERLTETITEIWRQSRGTYGSPRVWAELRLGQDISISRKRVERLMRQAGIEGIYRRRRRHGTTRRDPHAQPSDDLVNRQFHPAGPDRLWVADITEHAALEGKVYLAVVIDAWSRRVIGWSIADHLRTELVVDALDMACLRRKPTPGEDPPRRPRNPIHLLGVRTTTTPSRTARIHGNGGRLLRQCDDGVVLGNDATRTPRHQKLGNSRRTRQRHIRMD